MSQNYSYRAIDPQGREHTGSVTAPSLGAATLAVSAQGLMPYEIALAEKGQSLWRGLSRARQTSLSLRELALFLRQLATLLGAGTSIDQALQIIARGSSRAAKQSGALLSSVREGKAFSQAIGELGTGLPPSMVAILRAGEASGALDSAVKDIADSIEVRNRVNGQIRSALVYPLFLCLMAVASMALVALVLVPTVRPILADAGVPLPWVLSALIWVQSTVEQTWPLLIPLIMAVPAGMRILRRHKHVLAPVHALQMRLPLVGAILRDMACERLFRSLGTLLRAGVPLVAALSLAKGTIGNPALEPKMNGIIDTVREGGALHRALREAGFVAEMWLQLIMVGEETARLDGMLSKSAEMIESELRQTIDSLMSLLTPILTLVIGTGVGALILSVMTAVLSVNDAALR